jgi:hypothetical protein
MGQGNELVQWPCIFVAKLLASLVASKAPLDRDSVVIHAAVPGPSLSVEKLDPQSRVCPSIAGRTD